MQVIKAHRERAALLRRTFAQLVKRELELFNTRSNSWNLQMEGGLNRESELDAVHAEIDDLVLELERLRDILADRPAPAARTAGQAAPASTAPQQPEPAVS